MKILIKDGFVVDSVGGVKQPCDILVENGKIAKVAQKIKADADTIIDATGKIIMPGIVDMHTHLREPGREDRETIASGTKAALKGGVTSVLAMPNTFPAIDCVDSVILLKDILQKDALANVFIAAAITKGQQGKGLTDIALLRQYGVVALSDDGLSVDSAELMFEALQKSREQRIVLISHCEDRSLSAGGVVNLGVVSTRLGLRGISCASEHKRVQRDIQLADKAKAAVHIAHVSCKESVRLIDQAKKNGVRVTAEAAPHHCALTEQAVLGYDTNMKMNPPLRSEEDVAAIKQGLKDGIIDVIASDHAPHTENEKDIEFERAAFGVIGLETELAVCITELVRPGLLGWGGLVEKLCTNPARILGIDKGTLAAGKDADLAVVDPDKEWLVEKDSLVSKSKNSAFLGKRLRGVVEYTICNGRIAYKS